MLPDGYSVRPLSPEQAPALAAAYRRNREHLGPWDPMRPDRFYTAEGQAADIAFRLEQAARGLFETWLLLAPDGDTVVGRVAIQNIVRGTMQGGTLGYWVDHGHLRRGLAAAAVGFAADRAVEMGLHRLDAGTMVENIASQRVLERCSFEQYGLAPRLLFLNGGWRDHVLFQRILHDEPPA